MTNLWFELNLRYEKMAENGLMKKVTESYLVAALTCSEAEERFTVEMTPFITGEYSIRSVKRAKLSEIFFTESDDADKWFRATLKFVTLNEKTGAEKLTSVYMMIQAPDLRNGVKLLDEAMKGTMADYIIASIKETNIIDVFNLLPEEEKDE